jgi:hypothetical protein
MKKCLGAVGVRTGPKASCFESTWVDPAIHNSNTRKFRGGRLAVPSTEDHRFPEELALEAVRQFMHDRGQVPTAARR